MPESSLQILKANLRAALAKQDVSQSEFARRVGLHQRSVNRLVGGSPEDHSPTLETLEAIAKGMGVSVVELLSPGFKAPATTPSLEPRSSPLLVRSLSRLIEDFLLSDESGRRRILALASECANPPTPQSTSEA